MHNELNVVGIQADLIWENPEKNLMFFENKIKKLSPETDLVILPEMFTTGFTMTPEKVAENMNGKSILWMNRKEEKQSAKKRERQEKRG